MPTAGASLTRKLYFLTGHHLSLWTNRTGHGTENVITEMATCGLREMLGAGGQLASKTKRALLKGFCRERFSLSSDYLSASQLMRKRDPSTKSIILITYSYFGLFEIDKVGEADEY